MALTIDDLRNAVAAYDEQHPRKRGSGIQRCDEVRRVSELPRRDAFEHAAELVRELTEALRQPSGRQVLRPAQAVALYEIAAHGGIISPIRVGGGKTLVAFLAGAMVGASKILVLMPAKLIKTKRKELIAYRKHWQIPGNITFLSYERLGHKGQAKYLEELRPDIIIADEAHKLRNPKTGRTRRVRRYCEDTGCAFIPVSGTFWGKRLAHWWHLAKWALKAGSPAPLKQGTMMSWARALDPEPSQEPGALQCFTQPHQLGADIREVYRDRVLDTPGVVATREAMLGTSLYLLPWRIELPGVLQDALGQLHEEWVLPSGEIITDPLQYHRAARQLECGCFLYWTKQPPQEWRDLRLEWSRFVRKAIRYSHEWDTELQVIQACDSGKLDDSALRAWRGVRDTFKPETQCRWVDDTPIRAIAAAAKEVPMVVWAYHVDVGQRFEQYGIPYYGQGGLRGKAFIEAENGKRSIAASIVSSGEGRNIHEAFANGFIAEFPRDPDTLEQLIGRHHRDGQPEDECYVWVAQNTEYAEAAWQRVVEASEHQQVVSGMPYKVLQATIIEDGSDDD